MSQQIDLNNTQCIVQQSHFGYDSFHNICSNTVTNIDWSVFEYLGFMWLSIIIIVAVLMVYSLFNDF